MMNQHLSTTCFEFREADLRQRFVVQTNGLEVRVTVWERNATERDGSSHGCMEAGGAER